MVEHPSLSAKSRSKNEFDFLLSPVRSCQSEDGQLRTGWTQDLRKDFLKTARPVFNGLLESITDKSYDTTVTAELRQLLTQLNVDFEEKIGEVFALELQKAIGLRDEVISDLEKQLHSADESVLSRVEVVESHYVPLLMEKKREIEIERERASSSEAKLKDIEKKLKLCQEEVVSAEQQVVLLQDECFSKEEKMASLKAQVKRHCIAIETLREDRIRDAEQYLQKIMFLNSQLEDVVLKKNQSQETSPYVKTIVDDVHRESQTLIANDPQEIANSPKRECCVEADSLSSLVVSSLTKVEEVDGTCFRDTKRLEDLIRDTQSVSLQLKAAVNSFNKSSTSNLPTRCLHCLSGPFLCLTLGALLPVCLQLFSDRSSRLELS